MSPTLTLDLGG